MAASNQADTTRWEVRLLASLQRQLTEAVGELRKIQNELREERERGQTLRRRIDHVEARINGSTHKDEGFVLSTGSPLSELSPIQEAQVQARDPAKRTDTTALLPVRARRHPMSTRSSTRTRGGTQKISVVSAVVITTASKGKRKRNDEDDREDSPTPKRNKDNRLASTIGCSPEPCTDCGREYCTCYLARQDDGIQHCAQENRISTVDRDFGQHFVPISISATPSRPRYLEVPIPSRQEIYNRWEEEKDEVYREDEEIICDKCFSFTGEVCICESEVASAAPEIHQRESGFNFDQYGQLHPCCQCGSNYCICLNPGEEL